MENISVNNLVESTTLSQNVSYVDTTIYVGSPNFTNGLPDSYGLVKINDEVISSTFAIITNVSAQSSKVITIAYVTPSIQMEKECFTTTLLQIIPEKATVIASDAVDSVSLDSLTNTSTTFGYTISFVMVIPEEMIVKDEEA